MCPKDTLSCLKIQIYRDPTDRITTRTTNNGTTTAGMLYSFTSDSDTPDMALDGNGTVIEKYLTLPGDLQLTLRPASTSASYLTASLPNLHGDTLATVNADNGVTGTFSYDPFGTMVASTAPAQTNTGHPLNTTNNASFGWEGQNIKATETNLSLNPIQMGARIYLASLGRFLQTDPVRGGTPNSYVYPTDPVNQEDLNGQWSLWGGFQKAAKWAWGGVKKAAKATFNRYSKRVSTWWNSTSTQKWAHRAIGWGISGGAAAAVLACGITIVCGVSVFAGAVVVGTAAHYGLARYGSTNRHYRNKGVAHWAQQSARSAAIGLTCARFLKASCLRGGYNLLRKIRK